MSAVTKPLAKFAGALNTTEQAKQVPVEFVSTIEKQSLPAYKNDPARFFLLFTMVPKYPQKHIKIEFASNAALDIAITNWNTAHVTTLAAV